MKLGRKWRERAAARAARKAAKEAEAAAAAAASEAAETARAGGGKRGATGSAVVGGSLAAEVAEVAKDAAAEPGESPAPEAGAAAGGSGDSRGSGESVESGGHATGGTAQPARGRRRERLKAGLARTRERVAGRLRRTLGAGRRVDDALLDEVEEVLYEADLGVEACEQVLDALREQARAQRLRAVEDVVAVLREELLRLLGEPPPPLLPAGATRPRVIVLVGVNGAGKTTTIGKLAARYGAEGKRVIVAAADTFRAAAIDQLAVWAERSGAEIVRQDPGTDPAAVVFDALTAARARGADLLLVDTAGRLHNKANLMAEVQKIRRVLQRADPTMPHETLLVIDGVTGQNGLLQARGFHAAMGLTGVVLTKLDGTAKGGVVVAVKTELGVPVRLVGVGEALDDLQDFVPRAFVDEILGGLGA